MELVGPLLPTCSAEPWAGGLTWAMTNTYFEKIRPICAWVRGLEERTPSTSELTLGEISTGDHTEIVGRCPVITPLTPVPITPQGVGIERALTAFLISVTSLDMETVGFNKVFSLAFSCHIFLQSMPPFPSFPSPGQWGKQKVTVTNRLFFLVAPLWWSSSTQEALAFYKTRFPWKWVLMYVDKHTQWHETCMINHFRGKTWFRYIHVHANEVLITAHPF